MRAHYGPWKFRRDNCTLEMTGPAYPGGSNPYYIDLDRCCTPEEMLDWVFQINGKEWGAPEVVKSMLDAFDDLVAPQASLCSFGQRSVIKNMGKHLDREERR
jgi:hypothetical protein